MSDILDKISKILTQAERTDNEHEADAFFKQAQLLASRYSIDLAMARQHTAKKEEREQPTHRTIHIGESGKKGNARLVELFLGIAHANDVHCNIAMNSTYVIPYGFPSDIDLCEALYAHLSYQMVESANAYLKKGTYKEERMWSETTWEYKPVDGRVARRSFYEAFTMRVKARLSEAQREAEQAAIAEEVAGSTGTALVLASKREEVELYYKKVSNARGSWKGWSGGRHSSSDAHRAGSEAGSRARISSTPVLSGGRKAIE